MTVHGQRAATLFFGLSLLSGVANAEIAACFYEHEDYKGRSYCIDSDNTPDEVRTTLPNNWNDIVSSVKVRPGFKITLHEHYSTPGNYIELVGDVARLTQRAFNDKASSYVKITDSYLNGYAVCLFADPNYSGDFACFNPASSGKSYNLYGDLTYGFINDRTTSVKVNPDYQVIVYKDRVLDATGSMFIKYDIKDLRYVPGSMNDQISGISYIPYSLYPNGYN